MAIFEASMTRTEKVLNGVALLFPSAVMLGHDGIIVSLLVLLVAALCHIKDRQGGAGPYRLLIWTFVSVIILSIPNVVLDGGSMTALDAPSRYLIGALVLWGLRKQQVSLKILFLGAILAGFVSFLIYPVYLYFILGAVRYKTSFLGEDVNILAITYFSIISLHIALVAFLYFKKHSCFLLSVLALVSSCLLSLVAVYSGSKVILISYPIALVLMFLARNTEPKSVLLLLLLPTVVGLGGMFVGSGNEESLMQRVQTDVTGDSVHHTSTELRLEMWLSGYHAFKSNPVFGAGFKSRKEIHNQLVDDGVLTMYKVRNGKESLHNEVINSLAKKGVVGLIIVSLLYLVPLKLFWHYREEESDNRYLSYAGVLTVIGMVVIGFTEAPLMGISTSAYYAVLMILLALSLKRETKSDS
ncbi:O-antigen ligase family protein [Thaumasiovibrio subtropicus]|uniref:O-antigen ligase family protein n=1 Tax=Thaumasiovibrio subtropicus TaxID=1891207 RepID=UPI00131DDEE0|nr:O-antigen ligase family protein [Thaumasiovibrio subtropicus]